MPKYYVYQFNESDSKHPLGQQDLKKRKEATAQFIYRVALKDLWKIDQETYESLVISDENQLTIKIDYQEPLMHCSYYKGEVTIERNFYHSFSHSDEEESQSNPAPLIDIDPIADHNEQAQIALPAADKEKNEEGNENTLEISLSEDSINSKPHDHSIDDPTSYFHFPKIDGEEGNEVDKTEHQNTVAPSTRRSLVSYRASPSNAELMSGYGIYCNLPADMRAIYPIDTLSQCILL